ncbi:MAG: hypothetical protein ACTHKG_12195 [Nocardioides sp.]
MRLFARDTAAPAAVVARAALPAGERVLAATRARDGRWLLATRRRLVIVLPDEVEPDRVTEPDRIGWEQVEAADWSRDEDRLRVSQVGEYGEPRPVHEFVLDDPGKFLPLLRERVTSSVVLQRRVVVRDKQGLFVVARRVPDTGEITWAYELDAGLDPDDPEVRRLAELGLQAAAEELGLS